MQTKSKKTAHDTIPEIAAVAHDTDPVIQLPTATDKLEGEGSYTAARRYDAAVAETVHGGKVEELAQAAKKALDGPEGADLKRAEQAGKERGKVPPARDRQGSHAGSSR